MLNNPQGGLGYAAEFQTSALPYVTSSVVPQRTSGCLRIDFPKISKFIVVKNNESSGKYLRVGFTRNGTLNLPGYFYLLNGGESLDVDVRVTSIYLAGDTSTVSGSILAGLTNIDSRQMMTLSGTLSDGSDGWVGVG
jgi:hypothetical protein